MACDVVKRDGDGGDTMMWAVLAAIFLLMPTFSYAQIECAEWYVCPYRVRSDDPLTRYLSIADARLGVRWVEIEVDGNQAIVCLQEVFDIPGGYECSRVPRGRIAPFLKPPRVPFNDGGTIGFSDRTRSFRKREIRQKIRDSIVDDKINDVGRRD